MGEQRPDRASWRRAVRYALGYFLFGLFWVLLSDRIVAHFFDDPQTLAAAQTVKGWAFIVFTALILFGLLWYHARVDAKHSEAERQQRADIESLNRFQQRIIETPQVWINSINADAEITLWNEGAEQISGYAREEVLGQAQIWEWLYPDADYREWVAGKAAAILHDGVPAARLETTIRTKNGEQRDLEWYSRQLEDAQGEVIGAVAFAVDVTRLTAARRALQERERELSALMANLPGMAYRCRDDSARTMIFVSEGCEDLTGYPAAHLLDPESTSYRDLVVDDSVVEESRGAIDADAPFALEYRIRRRDGSLVWVLERGSPVTLGDERFLEGIVLEITDRKQMEEELQHLASHDQLTGLYNRRTMDRYLRDELARATRYDRPLSLIWLDIDYFKHINDQYGHPVGDTVLRQVSDLLRRELRTTDSIARYGGEEIIVAMPEMPLNDAIEAGERLRQAAEATPFDTGDGASIALTVSVGVATYPDHGTNLEQLYRAADDAMYRSKEAGRNTVSSLVISGAAG
ncbi:MAG: diguanylate cyclase [Ectothiorhodospiraceae bacterium]